MKKTVMPFILLLIGFAQCNSQTKTPTEQIRINQVGYFVNGTKKAVLVGFHENTFEIWTNTLSEKCFSGTLLPRLPWAQSGEDSIQIADFSSFAQQGTFVLVVGNKKSYPFEVSNHVLDSVAKMQMKFFYFNRCSYDLLPQYAGKWARSAGHANTAIRLWDEPARQLDLSGGWYDAGDYGLYTVTASMAVCQILMAYEQFPHYWNRAQWNIPESKNAVPDILDEVKWELRWMYKMKDRDNGVFYKLTSRNHAGFVMPNKNTDEFFCMTKNATSAYDYAASFALAARVYKAYNAQYPRFADSCLEAAQTAWTWATTHEGSHPACSNPAGVHTGDYGDDVAHNGNDNKILAGVELFITTGDSSYLTPVALQAQNGLAQGEPNWIEKRPLACLELALHGNSLAQQSVFEYADEQIAFQDTNSYAVNIGKSSSDFNWGSNRCISNRATVLLVAYILGKDRKYLYAATNAVDYLLGRNATGYCFITGFGTKRVMFPHHRPSGADGVHDPVPGLPVQGPYFGNLGDGCNPQRGSAFAAKNYIDHQCAYVCNEECIDEGAAHVFNLGGLMDCYLQQK